MTDTTNIVTQLQNEVKAINNLQQTLITAINAQTAAIATALSGSSATRPPPIVNLGTVGATTTFDATYNRVFVATLGAPVCALLPITEDLPAVSFVAVLLRVIQDAVGGRTLGPQAGVTWAGSGYVPGINPAPGSLVDIEYTSFDSGSTWVAVIVDQTPGS